MADSSETSAEAPDAVSSPSRSLRVLGVELSAETGAAVDAAAGASALRDATARRLGVAPEAITGLRIARRALDARRRGRRRELRFVHHVDVDLAEPSGVEGRAVAKAIRAGRARAVAPPIGFERADVDRTWRGRSVVVVGAGPAGLYAAWTLACHGVSVDLIDRGPGLRERGRAVAGFDRTRELDPERNLLFGEGGAGTYSDGKLYTRTQHALEAPILQTLIEVGADPEIAYDARAHVGTDRLHRILPRLRARLESMGVRFHFGTRLESIERDPAGRARAVRTTEGELPCDAVVLALGHSARDTIEALAADGLAIEAKPFQIGLRIEHPQALVDAARLGPDADVERLGHAYYALVARAGDGVAAVHSFCMCPGGQIVAAVAQPGLLCTNGMSNSRHSSPFANSGLVVTLGPREYGPGPFAGVALQARLEAEFFRAGGGDWAAPAQRVPDFLAGRETGDPGRSSYRLGLAPTRLDRLLPESMTLALRRAIARFDRQIPGYASDQGLLVGIESRSSGPIRMPRDPVTRAALGQPNVWPVGEGAGHAGGIMSAAIDGARSAWALLGAREEA